MTLNTTVEDTLTNTLWQHWKQQGTQTRLTWLELHKLTCHLTKRCRETEQDYQTFDFTATLDSKLNYYENLSIIDEATTGPAGLTDKDYMAKISFEAETEQEAFNKVKEERDDLLCKCGRLEQKLKELRQNVNAVKVFQQPTITAIAPELQIKQKITNITEITTLNPPELNPETTDYTDAELKEIQHYLTQRNLKLHFKATATKTKQKTVKFLRWALL